MSFRTRDYFISEAVRGERVGFVEVEEGRFEVYFCKLLLGQGTPLRGRQLMIDLLSMEMHIINMSEDHRERV